MANSYTDVSCVCVFELLNQIGVLKGAFFFQWVGNQMEILHLIFFFLFLLSFYHVATNCWCLMLPSVSHVPS